MTELKFKNKSTTAKVELWAENELIIYRSSYKDGWGHPQERLMIIVPSKISCIGALSENEHIEVYTGEEAPTKLLVNPQTFMKVWDEALGRNL